MKLYICEIFQSIQGESSFTGLPTTFVRLAGCPFHCVWCDSTYAKEEGTWKLLDEVLSTVSQFGWNTVCVTGGEPLSQSTTPLLLQKLVEQGHLVSLETSGCLPIDGVPHPVRIILDVKCPGSGMVEKNKFDNFMKLRPHDEVKFVLTNKADYTWAKEVVLKHRLFDRVAHVLFSPVWGALPPTQLVAWMQEDKLPARLNVQLHKYLWGPASRGV